MSQAPSPITPLLTWPSRTEDQRTSPESVSAPAEDVRPLRLLIEKSDGISFVYKFIDETTGEIIKQYPREQLVRMAESPDYTPGAVFEATV